MFTIKAFRDDHMHVFGAVQYSHDSKHRCLIINEPTLVPIMDPPRRVIQLYGPDRYDKLEVYNISLKLVDTFHGISGIEEMERRRKLLEDKPSPAKKAPVKRAPAKTVKKPTPKRK